MMPANRTNPNKSMMLKNNKNGPTKTTIKAPAHKPLADPLLSALGSKAFSPTRYFLVRLTLYGPLIVADL
jgi:hypothetical protein